MRHNEQSRKASPLTKAPNDIHKLVIGERITGISAFV